MKSRTSARQIYLAGDNRTEARTWRIVRRDGLVLTLTNAAIDLVKDGEKYSARTGVTASAVVTTAGLSVANHEISGSLSTATFTEADIAAGLWDGPNTIFVADVNYKNVAQGQTIIAVGSTGRISAGRLSFTVECRSLTQMLAQNIGRTVSPYCDADVFDARCGKDPTPYRVTGSVTGGVTDNKHFADSSITHASGWFDFGMLTWTSGENAGWSQEIKKQEVGVFTLQLRMPYTISVGDDYTMLPGCNKMLKGGPSGASVSGIVDSNNLPADTFTAPGFAQPSGFFNGGILTWLQGQNHGVVVHIATYVSDGSEGTFTMTSAMLLGINIGDTFTIVPNTNTVSTFSTGSLLTGDCKVKYDNVDNHRGFPYGPGLNRTLGEANAPG